MFPAGKKFFITLYKAPESFLLTCQDPAALNNVILQMTDCIVEVPTVELTDDLKEEERLKVGSKEGICYSLMNDYYKNFLHLPQRHHAIQQQHNTRLQTPLVVFILG